MKTLKKPSGSKRSGSASGVTKGQKFAPAGSASGGNRTNKVLAKGGKEVKRPAASTKALPKGPRY